MEYATASPDPALAQALRRELLTGERVLWSASPRGGWLLGGFAAWLFAIPWTVFALGWEAAAFAPWFANKTPDAIRWGFGIVFPLFGLPFIAIGFWMLSRPIQAIRQARRTLFALTDRRVIRLVEGRRREVQSVLLDQIGPIDRRERADGHGDLAIQTHSRVDSDGDRITEKFLICGVPEVARLERLLHDARSRGG